MTNQPTRPFTKSFRVAKSALEAFEADSESLSAEECIADLDGRDFDVSGNERRGYTILHRWTLKGLQHYLARERFIESVRFGEGNEDE